MTETLIMAIGASLMDIDYGNDKKAKFNIGDHVMVTQDSRSFDFYSGDVLIEMGGKITIGEAIVIEKSPTLHEYDLHIKGRGNSAWYKSNTLKLLEKNRKDLLEEWEKERDEVIQKISNLDWIFEHGNEVIEKPYGACIQSLANCFGLMDLWGERGEGIDYDSNHAQTLSLAKSFLENNDKDGWLNACKNITMTLMNDKCINRPLKIQLKKST